MPFDFSYVLEAHSHHWIYTVLRLLPVFLWILSYVLSSVGIYTMAKHRAIPHAWLAWVPVANVWVLGSLADQYRYVAKGQLTSRRKLLLGLKIADTLMQLVILIFLLGAMEYDMRFFLLQMTGVLIHLGGILLLALPISILLAIFYFIALGDVYQSCCPDHAVTDLVLSMMLRPTEPFFLFFNRDSEKGMPPRRPVYTRPAEDFQSQYRPFEQQPPVSHPAEPQKPTEEENRQETLEYL